MGKGETFAIELKPESTTFKASIPESEVIIGGESVTTKFVPNINQGKWNDEAWLNINAHNCTVTDEVHEVVGDKVSVTVGSETHRYYTNAEGGLNAEVEFASRPSDIFEYKLTMSSNLVALYQILTQAEKDEGCSYTRPDAEGSYAFYIKDKRNGQYRSGKFCHIYRPTLTDANGDTCLCDLNLVGDILQVNMNSVNPGWLDTAVYPVILDKGE
jgi:hypothetical protein